MAFRSFNFCPSCLKQWKAEKYPDSKFKKAICKFEIVYVNVNLYNSR